MSHGMWNIAFVWAQYWNNLVSYVQQSSWLIFPWEEDFGIVPIEVMAAWKPIFALKKWWLTETVIQWETWEFFDDPNGKDFIEKFQIFHSNNTAWKYTSAQCKKQAQKFDKKLFEKRILEIVHWDMWDSK
jgi:glycosyltransferase involved in cell wall biosynthesis